MTLDDFISALQRVREYPSVKGTDQVLVHYSGGVGASATPVRTIQPGFDWTHRKIVLHTEIALFPSYRPDMDS